MFYPAIKLQFSQLLEDTWSFLLSTLLLWANDTGIWKITFSFSVLFSVYYFAREAPQMAFFRIYFIFIKFLRKFHPYFMYNIAILAKKKYWKNIFSNIVRTHQKCLESISNPVGHTENSEKRCQLKMIFFAHFV